MTSTTETPAATEDKPTVRTYRVQYNAGADGDTETYIDAESYTRTNRDSPWITFACGGRIVAEVAEHAAILIEEMRPLNPSEREELEELRETVAILDDPDAVADLAQAMAETREAATRDRDRTTDDDKGPQTDWSAYHPCGTCLQQTGEPCRFTLIDGGVGEARINPHLNRERLPAA